MATLSMQAPRRDVLLHRGVDETWAWRCLKDQQDGSGLQRMDVSGWSATLTMTLPDGREAYRMTASRMTSSGLIWFDIPASAFTGSEWAARPVGDYKVTASPPGGGTILIGHGRWTLG